MISPARNVDRSLTALLDIGPDELLGVLLQHLVDLVEDRVNVVGQLLLALLDFPAGLLGVFLGLLATPGGLPLAAGVLGSHTEPPRRGASAPQRYPRLPTACPILEPDTRTKMGFSWPGGRKPPGFGRADRGFQPL